MDIAGLSIALNQSQVKQQASVAILKKAMTAGETNAAGMIKMLTNTNGQGAPHPHLGGKVDIKG